LYKKCCPFINKQFSIDYFLDLEKAFSSTLQTTASDSIINSFLCVLNTGLLGTITKTAEISNCPGKCIHALASLLCDEVREDIQCPQEGLRCCVDRRRKRVPVETEEQGEDTESVTERPTAKKKMPPTESSPDAIPASSKSVRSIEI